MKGFKYGVLRSIVGSTIFKLSSSLISFITIPILLKDLGTSDYAIWVTTTALLSWISVFDFGVGYSLKNKTTEALAINDMSRLLPAIAGTFQFYILSTLLLLIIFIISLFYVNIFKEHKFLAILVYLPVIMSFPFSIGNFLLQALSKFNLLNFLILIQNVLWLGIVLFKRYTKLNMDLLVLASCYSLIYLVLNWTFFFIAKKEIKIKIDSFRNWRHLVDEKKSILIGLRFFLLQLSSLFLYSIGNVLTYDYLDLSSVARYDIINKIFLLSITIFNIVITVFWTEISKAKASYDRSKLLKMRKQLFFAGTIFVVILFLSIPVIPYLIRIWTNGMVQVEIKFLFVFAVMVSVQAIAYCGAVFLNAFEQLRGQIIFSIIASVLMIPLSKYMFKCGFTINSVPLSSTILTIPTMIFVVYKSKICINNIAQQSIVQKSNIFGHN